MSRRRPRWTDYLAPVGEAGLSLFRAEYDVVTAEIKGSSRTLVRALLLLAIALFVLFWAIGAFAYVLVEIGALYLPRWGAALSVLGLFLVVAVSVALVARRRFRQIDSPAATVRRRIEDHRNWWEHRITALGPRPGGARRGSGLGSEDQNSDREAEGS